MPKLSRIRISGNKYDGFQKRHKDSIFELGAKAKGDHTLFTLQNGSGKGVMLQLISQIMLPGTSWGRNNGNKVEGMFYDRHNNFKPYTFHVALEWNLDYSSDKRLLIAICVSAHMLNESEGKVGLKYFLYTHEYSRDSKFSLINMPLHLKSDDRVLSYDELESLIDDKQHIFTKYSKTAVSNLNSDYYQYLASHGIYRSEWEIMKTINRSEGGLERYFSQAKDNQALFDKLIIPAVSESINSDSGTSLLNMFVENIKIAESLPELISRSADINQLLKMVEPLLSDSKRGVKLDKITDMIRERGNNCLRALESRKTYLQNELQDTQQNKEEVAAKIEELEFEQWNLKYAVKLRKLKELEKKQTEFEEKIATLETELAQLQGEKKKLRLNRHYLSWQRQKREYQRLKKRIERLESATDLTNLQEQIALQKDRIKDEWPKLKRKLEESSQTACSYLNHLDFEQQRLYREEEELKVELKKNERIIDSYQAEKKKLDSWRENLKERFNPLQLMTPDYLLEQLSEQLEKKEDKLEDMTSKREALNLKIEEEREEQEQLKIELARQEKDYQSLEEDYQQQKAQEEVLFTELVKLLELDKFKEVYSQEWLRSNRSKVERLLTEKEDKLEELTKEVHKLELALVLNEEDYWIANHDQKKLYQKISQLDIKVYYGSDFLINFCDDQAELWDDYPLLSYGLILMYEADWKKVKRNLTQEDLFRAPVPIFINHQLEENKGAASFKLLHGQEEELIKTPQKYQEWYSQLDIRKREIEKTLLTLQQKIKNIRRVIYNAEQLLQQESAAAIKEKLTAVVEEIENLEQQIKNREQKIKELKGEDASLEEELARKESRIKRLKEDHREIKNFAEKIEQLKSQETKIAETEERIVGLEEKMTTTTSKLRQNNQIKPRVENKYQNWLDNLELFIVELQELVPKLEFNEQRTTKQQSNSPQLYDYCDSALYANYRELLDLEKREEEKNVEIKFLRKDRKKAKEQILKLEKKMEELAADWRDYSFAIINREELEIKLEELKEQLEELGGKIKKFTKKNDVLKGKIDSKKEQLNELRAEIKQLFQRSVRPWLELNLKEKDQEINAALEEDKKYLEKISEMINDYHERISNLNALISKLDFYQLDSQKGKIRGQIKEEVRANPEELVADWIKDYQENQQQLKTLKEETEDNFYQFKGDVNRLIENDILRTKIQEGIIDNFRSENYNFNHEILLTFQDFLHNELNTLDENKNEAEEAREQWAERSAMHIMRIINSLQEMINNMVYHNQQDYAFPLVRLRRTDLLPKEKEEIMIELKEYFIELIEKFKRKNINVERLSLAQLKKYIGDAALFSRILRGRYPVLQVYKMTERNEFLYASPKDHYYADWEAVIQGKGDIAEGSGGQSLSINAFMMMMLLNYKKQRLHRDNPWTVLLLDNPFGKASAAHVLDPVFEIANKLNFQIIAFAAPEIIKTEISERFPTFWALEISKREENRGTVTGQVIYGERVRQTETTL
ncbi:hypothetical protein MWH25_02335 [Natroniella acetigena]|uniref:hypothetical protein n=1 Tax=Natroniella acetigena TaxID=52004 RepID=UPI00200B4DF8|nr:hypothetical protein [Natroniella acetigena]MCK8826588.1 hypothetical protein [Natroniella acetigena]